MPVMEAPDTTLGAEEPSPDADELIRTSLTDRCNIERRSVEEDGMGGIREFWDTIAYDVPCLLLHAKADPTDDVRAEHLTAVSKWALAVLPDTDILKSDRVLKDGLYYEVVDTDTGQTRAVFLSVTCIRMLR